MTERESIRLWSQTAASNASADGGIAWPEGQLPSTVNNSARGMMAAIKRRELDTNGSLTASGSANAYTLSIFGTVTAYNTGDKYRFAAGFTNTAAATINVSNADTTALGATALRVNSPSGDVALTSGQITSGCVYDIVYSSAVNSSAGGFIVLNPSLPVSPIGVQAATPQFVAIGDSRTAGVGGGTPYTSGISLTAYKGIAFNVSNIGVGGRKMEEVLLDVHQNLSPLCNFESGMNVLAIWGCHNDGGTAAQVYSLLESFCRQARTYGWRIIIITETSSSGEDARGQAINTYIRANWAAFADEIADAGADANIGALGTYSNLTYFTDGVHLTNAGYLIVKGLVEAAHTRLVNRNCYSLTDLYGQQFTTDNRVWCQSFGVWGAKATVYLGGAGTTGAVGFLGSAAGTLTLQPPSSFTSYILTLPTSAGLAAQAVVSAGPGNPWTYLTLASIAGSGSASDLSSGTVPSARMSGSYTGITGTGTLTAGATGGGFTVALGTSTVTGLTTLLDTVFGSTDNRVLSRSFGAWAANSVIYLGGSSATGGIGLLGATSGTVTIQPQTAAGTYNFNLPITAGSAAQVLTSQAGGTTAMTWTTLATVATTGSAADLGSGTLPSARLVGSYTSLTGTGTLTVGATGAGFTINFGTSTLSGAIGSANVPAATTAAKGGALLPTVTVYTSGTGATHTTKAGAQVIKVRMIGGGGGGGGSGTGSPGAGGAGGNSTFGGSLTASGGAGGAGSAGSAAAGGTASGGDFNLIGGNGGAGSAGTSALNGGGGGVSFFGGAGNTVGAGGTVGSSAQANTGSGGGGATAGTGNGAGGAAGGYLEKTIVSPSATYTYTVGTAGTAGTAGTSGQAGGAGAAGQIIVEEW